MKRNGIGSRGCALLLMAVVVIGGVGAGLTPAASGAARATEGSQAPGCTVRVPSPEPKDLAPLASVTADQAVAAARAAFPGDPAVRESALENENGCLVWAVELANGVEVKVDAGNGAVLGHEKASVGTEHEGRERKESGETDEN